MYILIGLISLYLLFLFLSSEGAAQWLRGKTAQVANEQGQGLVEYALLISFIALILILILIALGEQIVVVFCQAYYGIGGSEFAQCTSLGVPPPTP